jgi:signal transduction histidine kinase
VLNEIISINSVVRAALMLLDTQLTKSTENLTVRYGERIPHFQGNFQKIEQVVINLVQNACEALRDRGRSIEVSTGHCSATDRVWVMVVDQGRGIPAEDLPHVTDPFFTTRRGRGGTGLGLSISSRIMQEHGGDIAFSSVPGQGTSVTISFPT